jgi:hypothetical protein
MIFGALRPKNHRIAQSLLVHNMKNALPASWVLRSKTVKVLHNKTQCIKHNGTVSNRAQAD